MTYYTSLPKALRDELARAAHGSTYDALDAGARELVAKFALTLGTANRGPVLVYVVRRLRHGIGAGEFPTPPNLTAAEGAYIDRRILDVLPALKDAVLEHRNHTNPPTPRLQVNPDGYTKTDPPTNVVELDDHRPPATRGPGPRIA